MMCAYHPCNLGNHRSERHHVQRGRNVTSGVEDLMFNPANSAKRCLRT